MRFPLPSEPLSRSCPEEPEAPRPFFQLALVGWPPHPFSTPSRSLTARLLCSGAPPTSAWALLSLPVGPTHVDSCSQRVPWSHHPTKQEPPPAENALSNVSLNSILEGNPWLQGTGCAVQNCGALGSTLAEGAEHLPRDTCTFGSVKLRRTCPQVPRNHCLPQGQGQPCLPFSWTVLRPQYCTQQGSNSLGIERSDMDRN